MPVTTRSQAPTIGDAVGPYTVERLIARSPHYEVWEACGSSGQSVALKLVYRPKKLSLSEVRLLADRLMHERQVLSLFDHPGIIKALNPHLTMPPVLITEYIAGPNLSQLIPHDGLPWSKFGRIAIQMAAALRVVHAAGVIHLDVKPGNIMVAKNGPVRLIDFGISRTSQASPLRRLPGRILGYDAETTQLSNSVEGSAGYIAPEQLCGQDLTPQTDVYGFGCTLFQALNGRPLFSGTSLEIATQHIRSRIPPQGHTIPPAIRSLIIDCLAKRPGDRPTLREVSTQLNPAP